MQLSRGFTCTEMVELMTDYLEGCLSRREARRFERHLSLCDGCSAYLEQLRTTVEATGRLGEDDLPPELRDRLLAAFREWAHTQVEPERGNVVVVEHQLVEDEELWRDDGDSEHGGWFCVATDPFPCPADGCSFVANHMTAAHLILVWEERDDPNLLRHAQIAQEVGRNPRVAVYQQAFGPSASYYAWIAAGKPVHGIRAR